MYLLAIDGGGTKTKFALGDADAKILHETVRSGLDFTEIGAVGFESTLRDGMQQLCDIADIDEKNISGVCIGIPCLGEIEKNDILQIDIVKKVFKNTSAIIAVNDVVMGMFGSLGCEKGIHVVCGTGSMAVCISQVGEYLRCGGWSSQFSDEGSGYWIGNKAIQLFSKQSDERAEKDCFYEIAKQMMNIDNDFDIITMFQDGATRSAIADVQKVLYCAAEQGSEQAVKIFELAALELYEMAESLYKRLGEPKQVLLSYSGGIIEKNEFVNKHFCELCEKSGKFNVIAPKLTPTQGGLNKIKDKLKENI